MHKICIALILMGFLSGCGAVGPALGGAALGTAAVLGTQALGAAEDAAEASQDYIIEGVAWRRELRTYMKDAVREKCKSMKDDAEIACWHRYYPTIEQLKRGIFGTPLETTEESLAPD